MQNRKFKKNSRNERVVLAKSNKFVVYHPECAPDNSIDIWVTTQKTVCHKCLRAIYKKEKTK